MSKWNPAYRKYWGYYSFAFLLVVAGMIFFNNPNADGVLGSAADSTDIIIDSIPVDSSAAPAPDTTNQVDG